MIFQGKAIQCQASEDGIALLTFDLIGESTNVFNKLTLDELGQCLESIKKTDGIKGLLLKSQKEHFILGADIFEFGHDMMKHHLRFVPDNVARHVNP